MKASQEHILSQNSEGSSPKVSSNVPQVGNHSTSSHSGAARPSPQTLICKNCVLKYRGYYCPRCGQSARTTRITMRNFFAKSIFSSLDIEKGLPQSIKALITHPGFSIRGYIAGKRVSLYRPVRFLVLVGAVATFISLRYNIFLVEQEEAVQSSGIENLLGMNIQHWYETHFVGFWEFANEYTTLINIISIPIFSLFSYLVFIKKGYNYAENLILNVYIVCMQLLLLVAFMPALEIFSGLKPMLMALYTLLTMAYNLWCYMCFYEKMNLKGFFLSALVNVLAYVLQFITAHSLYYSVVALRIITPGAAQ